MLICEGFNINIWKKKYRCKGANWRQINSAWLDIKVKGKYCLFLINTNIFSRFLVDIVKLYFHMVNSNNFFDHTFAFLSSNEQFNIYTQKHD